MGQLPESDIAVKALRPYLGLYPGVVRAEIKAPHIFSLEEPIDSHIPSSLDGVTDPEEALAEVMAPALKAVTQLDIPPVSQIIQPLQEVGARIKTLNERLNLSFKGVFKRLREIDFEEVNDKMFSAGRELGERGWLVGPLMSAQGLFRVLGETDQLMKERYPVERLVEMVEEPDDFRWQKTILEAIHSYRNGRYRVVILSLFPVIEALVRERAESVEAGGSSINDLNRRVYKKTETRAKEEFHLLAAQEASILGFIEARWLRSPDMSSVGPSVLSTIDRNWAVHGEDNPERWNPIDAHKLLQVAAVLAHEKRPLGTADED